MKKLLVVATLALILVSCGDGDSTFAGSDSADGVVDAPDGNGAGLAPDILGSWDVEAVAVDSADSPPPNPAPATVVVEPGGISGDAGCNRFFGEWSSTPDGIEVGELAITEIGCLDTVDWFDLLTALSEASNVTADGDARVLASADGAFSVRLVPSGTLAAVDTPEEPEEETVPDTSEPGDADAADQPDDAADYIRLTETEAGALAEERGHPWRISEIDGEPQMLTMDHDPNRYNFAIADGVVIRVRAG